jgi:hypothetical protein
LFNLAPARFEFVEPLLKPRCPQAIGNRVNKAGELPVYIGEFTAPVVYLGFVLAALGIDLFLKSADEFLDKIGRHQSLL